LKLTKYYLMSSLIISGFLVGGCSTTPDTIDLSATKNAGQDRKSLRNKAPTFITAEPSKKESEWGIRVVGLRTTMSGMMIDFRYRIIDPSKAASLLDINNKAYLRVEKNGARLGVPNSVKIGALRQTTHAKKVKKGRDYFILFGNPGRKYAEPGDKLAVVIGDVEFDNLILQ